MIRPHNKFQLENRLCPFPSTQTCCCCQHLDTTMEGENWAVQLDSNDQTIDWTSFLAQSSFRMNTWQKNMVRTPDGSSCHRCQLGMRRDEPLPLQNVAGHSVHSSTIQTHEMDRNHPFPPPTPSFGVGSLEAPWPSHITLRRSEIHCSKSLGQRNHFLIP